MPVSDQVVPPQNLEAEEHVIGAMLTNNNATDTVSDILTGTEFYRESHTLIYQACLNVHNDGNPVECISVADRLERNGHLERVGGKVRLYEIAALTPASANVAHWARIVMDCAIDRALITAGSEIGRIGYERKGEAVQRLDSAEQIVYELGNRRSTNIDLSPGLPGYITTLQRLRDNPGLMVGVPSGFEPLDEITQGFSKGNLIILGARPSMGKSALMLCMTANLLGQGEPVGIFTLEMSKPEILQRLISIGAAIPGEKLKNPRKLTDQEWQRVLDAAARLNDKPLHVREAGTLTPTEVRAQIRRLKAKVPNLALVFVDYLQLMSSPGHEGRTQEVSEISRALKATARDLDVPIVALSQLNRGLEQRVDKRPILSDLRESGSIEQDADVVAFIYRDQYYNPVDAAPKLEWAEIIVAKHRNGPTDTVRLPFLREQARFSNPAKPHLADMAEVA